MAEIKSFTKPGVLTGGDEEPRGVVAAYTEGKTLKVVLPGGTVVEYPTEDVTVGTNTDRLEFTSEGTSYRIRELREDDGTWLSRYKMFLPLEALGDRVTDDLNTPDESLDAFAVDDAVHVSGLVYTTGSGRFVRIDGDWVLMSPNDNTFEDMLVMSIDPEKASKFIELYDRNFVTVTEAEDYEVETDDDDETPVADSDK